MDNGSTCIGKNKSRLTLCGYLVLEVKAPFKKAHDKKYGF